MSPLIHIAPVCRTASAALGTFSLAFLPSIGVALLEERGQVLAGTATSGLSALVIAWGVTLVTSGCLWFLARRGTREFYRREGLVSVLLIWVLAVALASVPYRVSGVVPRWSDAIFEAVSGLTTNGGTVFGTGACPSIASVPKALLLWRSMTNWVGGVGIVVIFCALLPALGVRARTLIEMEVSGVQKHGGLPRINDAMRGLVALYCGLSVIMIGALRALGLEWFDSICATFGAISTGGFYTQNASIGTHANPAVEWVMGVFMIVGALNFGVLLAAVRRGIRGGWRELVRDYELRLFFGLICTATIAVTLSLKVRGGQVLDGVTHVVHDYESITTCLRDAFFQVSSVGSTTGFTNVDYSKWPAGSQATLLLLMGVGGCAGSTAGGVKVVRFLICLLLIRFAVRRFVRPASVERIRLGDELVSDGQVSAVVSLVLLWIAMLGLGSIVLLFDSRMDLVSAFSSSLASMNSFGPALSSPGAQIDVGPYGGFGTLTPLSQLTLAFLMIVGRLEVFPVVAVFSRSFWR